MNGQTTKAIKKAWAARWGNIKQRVTPPLSKEFKLGYLAGVEHVEKDKKKDKRYW